MIPYSQRLPRLEVVTALNKEPMGDQEVAAVAAVELHQLPADRGHPSKVAMARVVTTVREMRIRAVVAVELLLPELSLLGQMPPTVGTASRRQLVDQALREAVVVAVELICEPTPEVLEQEEVEVAEVLVQLAEPQLVAPLILVAVVAAAASPQLVVSGMEQQAAPAL